MSKNIKLSMVLFIVLGCLLRVLWNADMQWKGDQIWAYETATEIVETGKWPVLANISGASNIRTPGMGVWSFAVLRYFVNTPLGLNRMVQALNILAVFIFLLLILLKVERSEKEIWLWGITLAAVSPAMILYSNHIWQPNLVPFFSVLIIFCHFFRNHFMGAFLWGILGAIIGQIQLSGFYGAFALWSFTVFYDVYIKKNTFNTKWLAWFLGSTIGAVPLIPWFIHVWTTTDRGLESYRAWQNIFDFQFYTNWVLDSIGINIRRIVMGKKFSVELQFLKDPHIFNTATYLVGVIYISLASIGIVMLKRLFTNISKTLKEKSLLSYLNQISQTEFYLLAYFGLMGILMTLSALSARPHYLLTAFPFTYIFFAKIFFPNRKIILTCIILNLILSTYLLSYIHKTGGNVSGWGYGLTYQKQMEIKEK
ncbi:MAG: hypothetical protein A3B70_06015 [Deltaproteobacteria bacterium RIFCSPHIGHO2_02_FULL_40_11]|nr:MAG: hypothetical protein A3B70_06015 [Deltaproteobacteria bacterium RIFCSPHIGHO2_02_FULL_40_11]